VAPVRGGAGRGAGRRGGARGRGRDGPRGRARRGARQALSGLGGPCCRALRASDLGRRRHAAPVRKGRCARRRCARPLRLVPQGPAWLGQAPRPGSVAVPRGLRAGLDIHTLAQYFRVREAPPRGPRAGGGGGGGGDRRAADGRPAVRAARVLGGRRRARRAGRPAAGGLPGLPARAAGERVRRARCAVPRAGAARVVAAAVRNSQPVSAQRPRERLAGTCLGPKRKLLRPALSAWARAGGWASGALLPCVAARTTCRRAQSSAACCLANRAASLPDAQILLC
jgi:hypothetical protein